MKERFRIIIRDKPSKILNVNKSNMTIMLNRENYFWAKQEDYPEMVIFDDEDEFEEVYNLILREIEIRKNPNERFEHWECRNFKGRFESRLMTKLLQSRLKPGEKLDKKYKHFANLMADINREIKNEQSNLNG